jgi:ribose-phosphate pyrophosphokinase
MTPVVVPLPGSEALAGRLRAALRARRGIVESRHFPDGETYLRLRTVVRGRPVVVAANLDRPDAKFLALEFLARLARDLGATRIGLVAPYLPYMRQDKRFKPGEAVTSNYFATLVSRSFDWMVTVDPHLHRRTALSQIYTIPAEAVHAAPLISQWIHDHVRAPLVIGPDIESSQWVAAVASDADAPYRILTKHRYGDRRVKVSSPRAAVQSGTPVIVDDILSTARTMIEAVRNVRSGTGKAPYCVAIHGIFADDADRALKRAGARGVVTCNTVPHPSNRIDVSPLLADAARRFLKRTTRQKLM